MLLFSHTADSAVTGFSMLPLWVSLNRELLSQYLNPLTLNATAKTSLQVTVGTADGNGVSGAKDRIYWRKGKTALLSEVHTFTHLL